MTTPFRTVNPGAAVIIWNYKDRLNADETNAGTVNEIEQVIINSASLLSVSTNKSKSVPAGQFQINLAPTVNWTARITPGSWCAILMSQNPIASINNKNPGQADPATFKMLGRIDSCRTNVDVNQESGARSTSFIVTGRDWCSVFDTKLYIDPIVRNNNLENLSAVGQSLAIIADDLFTEWQSTNALPTSSDITRAIIKTWGAPITDIGAALNAAVDSFGSQFGVPGANPQKLSKGVQISSDAQFQLPKDVGKFMKQGGFISASKNFADIIKTYDGKLVAQDTYQDTKEAQGYPDPASLYGMHTFWQILQDNCNPVLNELVADTRWEGDKPQFALYKRIRPFINRPASDLGSSADAVVNNVSPFKYVRQIPIALEDVVTINAGTNWRDKINFIELRPQPQLLPGLGMEAEAKIKSQIIDKASYEREGFKPLIQMVYYMPYDGESPAILEAVEWRHLLREWYFNTHLMLNGSLNIIGQDQYIQVGDNIKVDSTVLGEGKFNSKEAGSSSATYLLAHVESISHNFSVNAETGARTFITTIQFVRGVITDDKGNIVGNSGGLAGLIGGALGISTGSGSLDGALDSDASSLGYPNEKNNNVVGTSTTLDPDVQKLKGN